MKNKRSAPLFSRFALLFTVAALMAACGGGGSPDAPGDNGAVKKAVAFPGTIPADAPIKGMWGPVTSWPVIAVHAVLMPDGRVMTYGTDTAGKQTGYFVYDIYDPASDSHLTLPNGTLTDIFCSSQLVLPLGGAVFIAGGDNWTGTGTTNTGNNNSNTFTLGTNTLARGNNMNRARWYSSSVTLINGETYIQGGTGGADRPEVRQADGTFRLLSGANTSGLDATYPRNFIAPDGRIFGYDSAGRMYYVNPAGTGTFTQVGQFASAYRGSDASAAMFGPGRILQFGGNSNGAIVIDINGATPTVTPTQSMSSQRRLVNATLLADGKVLATGGSQVWNQLTGVNNIAEIWNPATGTWLQGAVGDRARLYHSTALLMPDASVYVMGGGAPGPQTNLNIEVYYPPYLFDASGALAPRPTIAFAPNELDIGRTFAVDFADATAIARVTLVKTGSATHSWNMEQRFLDLAFSANGSRLTVQAPGRAGDAPPGHYLLFVIDHNGVPSVAKIVRMNVAADPNPAVVPSIANPGNQSGLAGNSVSLQIAATDPNGDPLTYSASGLPPGLGIEPQSGRISGTPSAVGNYAVTVAASDGINSATANFTWSITGVAPLVLNPPQPSPAPNGTTITYTASANGIDTLFRWNFGDGTPETAWSTSPTATHTFTRAGVYYVTVTAIDAQGLPTSRTFLQVIHLPLAAQRATQSSTIALETRASGNPRVWLVNQDNDSVTVFDATTRAKLAEINVGVAPRSIAIDAGGFVWVTNRQAASISVISAASLAVSRTIALPRASQPYGIAMSPSGASAFVALGATGQLLKFDTASYAQTGSTSVGPNVRHVAVATDGGSVYVSRFITPPLPGEHTASVAPTAGTGGEVVVVDAASMTVARTVILAHSDRPDFENQGRGVPNYLGAAAISPDGTQAWVPSKQDNVQRGALRDGTGLNFQSTVRSISSRIDLATGLEDHARRVDHDNSSVASAALFDPRGVYLFVAQETSREVAVVDAHAGFQLFRFDVGRAPQGLALSPDGRTLYVNNFMDRTLGVYDLRPLIDEGQANVPAIATLAAVTTDKLSAQVRLGKQLFYDARDTRLARDRYMSCASCHNDGGHDGRTWDLTGFGEGLRNTISLRGRAAGQGFLHWTANFDELQDFEGQIRALAGGTGLMTDAQFGTGTRSQPLGDPKTGVSADLDALAAYVASLATFDQSPYRTSTGALTAQGSAGRTLFQQLDCASCHAGTAFTNSGANTLSNIGTIRQPTSGSRLGGTLTGIDVQTLRDAWATAPYLHDGSAATIEAAIRAHSGLVVTDAEVASLASYVREIGSEEVSAPGNATTGTGLTGRYFNNTTLSGTPVLARVDALVDFNWGSGSPGGGVGTNNFSVRWTGFIKATVAGSYRFQTVSDDGVRLWINGTRIINNWSDHAATTNTSGNVSLSAGQMVPVTMEYYEKGGQAVARLRWRTPGTSSYVPVPTVQMYPQ